MFTKNTNAKITLSQTHCYIVRELMHATTGWAKKVRLLIFAITLSTASQLSYFLAHICNLRIYS